MSRRGEHVGSVLSLIEEHVVRRPGTCAVHDPLTGAELSYGELWRRSGDLAGVLRRRGARRGEIVATALRRSLDLVVALLGIARAGAAYLALDVDTPPARQSLLLRQARVRQVVVAGERDLLDDVERVRLPTGGEEPYGPNVPLRAEEPLYVAFTSGTTGTPKGVVVPHRAVRRLAVDPVYCTIGPGHRVASLSNPAFDATTFEVWTTLAGGGTISVLPGIGELPLEDWVGTVRRAGVQTMFVTTSLFHMIALERPRAFESLETLLVGGEVLEAAAARAVLEAGAPRRFVNVYGPTETTTFATYFDCTLESIRGADRVPIGYPIQGTSVHVLDAERRPLPDLERGELYIGGPGVSLGYLGDTQLTAERFVDVDEGVLYRSGDVAARDTSGAIHLYGRVDRQVKLRGFRIEPDEIEHAIVRTTLVSHAVVEKIGSGSAASLTAFVVPSRSAGSAGRAELPEALRGALEPELPAYMIPSAWHVLAELPIGSTGKLDRAALVRLHEAEGRGEPGAAPAAEAPTSEADVVARVWCEVLGVESAEPSANFIDLGGNSISAVQAASRIQEALGVECPPGSLLEARDFGELVAVLVGLAPVAH